MTLSATVVSTYLFIRGEVDDIAVLAGCQWRGLELWLPQGIYNTHVLERGRLLDGLGGRGFGWEVEFGVGLKRCYNWLSRAVFGSTKAIGGILREGEGGEGGGRGDRREEGTGKKGEGRERGEGGDGEREGGGEKGQGGGSSTSK